MTSTCDDFVQFLEDMSTNSAERRKFGKVFGTNIPYTINITKDTITAIQKEYNDSIKELSDAFIQFQDDDRRKMAISNQIRKSKAVGLLNYLSEHQFIPNANMPTNIVTFDYIDDRQSDDLYDQYKKAREIRDQIAEEQDEMLKDRLKQDLGKVNRKIDKLQKGTTISRDIVTALNEYAP